MKNINIFVKLPVELTIEKENKYKKYSLELDVPSINAVLKQISLLYNPKVFELLDKSGKSNSYFIFINGNLIKDTNEKIKNNDRILIISPVVGG